jgi:hypothetical protein
MDNQPKRSLWERLLDVIQPAPPHPEKAQSSLEVTPETQVLAARIIDVMETSRNPQQLNPEQRAQWDRFRDPFMLMYRRYDITKAYQHWQRSPKDEEARQAWQSLLLGVLTSDKELHDKFNAALPLPEPKWLMTDEAEPARERATTVESAPPAQDKPAVVPTPPIQPIPSVETAAAVEPETINEVERPSTVGDERLLRFEHLVRELRNDAEFYKIVFAMRYENPSLYDLAARLADEPKLSNDLYEFFRASNFGTQLVSK